MSPSEVVVNLLLLAAASALLGAFANEARAAIAAVCSMFGSAIEHADIILTQPVCAVWDWLKPTGLKPDRALLGVGVLAAGGGIVYANYGVMGPTVGILLPAGRMQETLAMALVGLGCVIGLLAHVAERGRALYYLAALGLTTASGVLAYVQAWVVTESLMLAVLRSSLAVLLQLVEMMAFYGGFSLAGPLLPVAVAAPLFLVIGVFWFPVRLFREANAAQGFQALLSALCDGAEGGVLKMRALVMSLTPAARASRRRREELQELEGRATIDARRSEIDLARPLAAHRAAARERETLEDIEFDRKVRSLANQHQLKHLPDLFEKLFESAAQNVLETLEQTHPELRSAAIEKIEQKIHDAGGYVSDAVLEIYRLASLFGKNGNADSRVDKSEPSRDRSHVN